MTHIDPTRESFEIFKSLPRDKPIDMLNLIRLRERAAYTNGRNVSGAEAYAEYGKRSGPVFQRVGGEIIWRGEPQVMLIGPQDKVWDIAFIARYPGASAFLEMVTDSVYQTDAVPHRQAAVLDSRLIRHAVKTGGRQFS
ncbi:MAG: DUF1330 domain-containing protein [Rhodobacterales bacterium CG15_BIG_FIL_POST_REV_8_21_14_020_59_13]|nr:MAG: DUF1330 domain-containing protein [Rhodobacterales bacterium CG15_BIG_FIL_POST_REV_8_21_14_020_59_13]